MKERLQRHAPLAAWGAILLAVATALIDRYLR